MRFRRVANGEVNPILAMKLLKKALWQRTNTLDDREKRRINVKSHESHKSVSAFVYGNERCLPLNSPSWRLFKMDALKSSLRLIMNWSKYYSLDPDHSYIPRDQNL